MKHADHALVKLELDMYWLAQAGQDPLTVPATPTASVFSTSKAASPTPHRLRHGPTAKHITKLGKGTLNWPAIFAQAHKQGIRYACLDQDETALPIDSLKENFAYLQTVKAQRTVRERQQTPSAECEHRMHALQNV
ncbi:hypothetical protein RBB79_21035 [Tunturiibacter empetritectus]|uniref:Sugar phosphate isomerase/epimerase n=1 Tax=Tunturiibacter lichenicola TaxID=2051959 RepID=A0A852VP33_9BACT|nr:hypothetical protein [Edaphobacter lichenicola]NYF92174.1 sugar phosphate isomerase/epimerase [Edaphobacter lichenicola]